jgi:cell division septum initiation protein DivIVA
MKSGKLGQLLEQIRDAIPDLQDVDEKGREILESLERDIHGLLDREDDKDHDDSILQRMQSAIAHFEVSHPTLTAWISEASAILSNAGI